MNCYLNEGIQIFLRFGYALVYLVRKIILNANDPVKLLVDIKNYTFAKTLIGAGANRLYGNNSLKIITEAMQQN